jgi:hypothetical protein
MIESQIAQSGFFSGYFGYFGRGWFTSGAEARIDAS